MATATTSPSAKAGIFFLAPAPKDECLFQLQLYTGDQLEANTALKFRHCKSGKYLSISEGSLNLARFTAFNTWEVSGVSSEELIDVLFLNDTYEGLGSILGEEITSKNKRKIRSILKQSITFCYRGKKIYEQFLKLESIKPSLKYEEQLLFSRIGYLPLLYKICKIIVEQVRHEAPEVEKKEGGQNQEQYNDNQQIYIQAVLMICAICKDNKDNIALFCQEIKNFFQFFGIIRGTFQLLYQLFGFNSMALDIMQNLQFSYKKATLKGFSVLLQYLFGKQFPLKQKLKILKLLKSLVLDESKRTILSHEHILLQTLQQPKKMSKIMFPLSKGPQDTLIVQLNHKQKIQLKDLIQSNRYKLQLNLLGLQLRLYISLCKTGSKRHLELFRSIVSEEMVKQYLKQGIESEFLAVFMEILIQIYLSLNIRAKGRTLVVVTKTAPANHQIATDSPSKFNSLRRGLLQHEVEMEMEEVRGDRMRFLTDANALRDIKRLILSLLQRQIAGSHLDSDLIIYMMALRRFVQLQICSWEEEREVLVLLTKTMRVMLEMGSELNDRFVVAYLEMAEFDLGMHLQRQAVLLIHQIKAQYHPDLSRRQYADRIVDLTNSRIADHLGLVDSSQIVTALEGLIGSCVAEGKIDLFLRASQIYGKLINIGVYFIKTVKNCIPIDSPDSAELLQNVSKLYVKLSNAVSEALYGAEAGQRAAGRRGLMESARQSCQLIEGVEDERVNMLAQKLMSQFGFLQCVVQYVCQRRQQLRQAESGGLFGGLFRFIRLFLEGCGENLILNEGCLLKLRGVFRHIDRGQVQMLYFITKSALAVQRQYSFLLECWVNAAGSCFAARVQIPLSLLALLRSGERGQERVKHCEALAELLVGEAGLVGALLKVERPGQFVSLEVVKLCEFRQEWVMYLVAVVRLLREVLEEAGEAKARLLARLREYLPIRLVLNLLEEAFRLEITSGEGGLLYVFILKQARKELMHLFSLVYLAELEEQHYDLVLTYLHKVSAFLTVKYIEDANNEAVLKSLLYRHSAQPHSEQDLKEMLTAYIRLDMKSHQEITVEIINTLNGPTFLFVTEYYNFCFKVYEKLRDQRSNPQPNMADSGLRRVDSQRKAVNISFMRELEYFLETALKQYREVLSDKLMYNEFVTHSLAYTSAVKTAQELTKKSSGLKYKYVQSEQDRLLLQGQQFFEHEQMKFTLQSFLACRSKTEKYLYECQLVILHNRRINPAPLHRSKMAGRTREIVELVVQKLKDPKADSETFVSYCALLGLYLGGSQREREWEPHLEWPEIVARLADSREDPSRRMLSMWLQAEISLMEDYFEAGYSAARRHRPVEFPQGDEYNSGFAAVKDRLKGLLWEERNLYDKKLLLEQSQSYFQHRRLNHAVSHHRISPELILRWLLLKLKYNAANVQRYFELIVEVVLVMKSYVRFILDFHRTYVTGELEFKIRSCLRVLLQAMSGGSMRLLVMLVQYQTWEELNTIMQLDDSLERNLEELDLSTYDFIKMLTRAKLAPLQASYLQGVLQLYNNSVSIYGQNGEVLAAGGYPLVPLKSYFKDFKSHAIRVMQQFSHYPSIAPQFFSKLDVKCINSNIAATYDKYHYLFNSYTLAAVYTKVQFAGEWEEPIADNMSIQNAVRMVGLRMRIDQLNGRSQTAERYAKIRMALTKQNIQSYLTLLRSFFVDLVLVVVGVCLRLSRRHRRPRSPHSLSPDQVFDFFLARLGRVEVVWAGRLYECSFMQYPECVISWNRRQSCLKQLNFASNQLKRESIAVSMSRFALHYENEWQFKVGFWRMAAVVFMAQYTEVIIVLCKGIVIIDNVLLVTNQHDSLRFSGFRLAYPFEIFAFLNLLLALCLLIVTLIRNIPLAVKVHRYNLEQGIGFLSRGYNSLSYYQRTVILAFKILFTWELLYTIAYTAVVCLVLLNKLFASILLLDLLLHIPSLQALLVSIWKPRYQVLLTMIAFIILQYFFSILLFFFFSGDVYGYCDNLGDCFTFVFVATFRAVNGFVGYLFQEYSVQSTVASVSLFGIFEDLYAIVIHTVMVAALLAVVINSFVVTKADNARQKEALRHACIVCNIDRSRFNLQNRTSFQTHKSDTHYLFNYFDYRYRLNKMKKEHMGDIELSVLESKNNDWIPDNRALELETDKDGQLL